MQIKSTRPQNDGSEQSNCTLYHRHCTSTFYSFRDLRGHIPAGLSVIPQQKNPAGLVWTALLFALRLQDAGQKPKPQHTHAVAWLPLLARGQAKNWWKLGWNILPELLPPPHPPPLWARWEEGLLSQMPFSMRAHFSAATIEEMRMWGNRIGKMI